MAILLEFRLTDIMTFDKKHSYVCDKQNVIRTVLVPTDFSKNAFNALKYSCQVFKYEICEICIVHAYTIETYGIEGLEGNRFEVLKETTPEGFRVAIGKSARHD